MSSILAAIQQKIVNVIKRFKVDELEDSVLPVFPELSWSNLKSELKKQSLRFTSSNVALNIKAAMVQAKLSEKVLRDRLSTLQLIDVSWHSKKHTWHSYSFISPNESVNDLEPEKLYNNLIEQSKRQDIKMNVKMYMHDGIMFVSMAERTKKRSGKFRYTVPIIFALFTEQKYFFCSKKNVASDILLVIAQSSGYNNNKQIKLTGRNLKSLVRVCCQKREGVVNSENINNPPVYRDAKPIERSTGTDFSQHKQRQEYAKKCFGDDPPTLESLSVNRSSMPFIHESLSLDLGNETMSMGWEFHSRNIAMLLTKLIERQILVMPVPQYLTELMILGKNELSIH